MTSTHALPGARQTFPVSPALGRLRDAIAKAGGRPVVVGGAVRDHLLGQASKDIDLEVFEIELDPLEAALATVGKVHAVGRAFGVLKVNIEGSDEDFDIALPRRENKVGAGHRGFVVQSDPQMTFAEAGTRRDFTLNALGVDLVDDKLLDPHGGIDDLTAGVLRHVSDAFDEDPLRVLRACQFAGRFALSIAPQTVERCRNLQGELTTLPGERVWEELKKLLLRSQWPSIGLCALRETGALVLFPELAALMGVQQEPNWHPEGDVWVHTLMVTDEAALLVRDEADEGERLVCVLGALCHDLGKPATTFLDDGVLRSPAHDTAGEAPTEEMLTRMLAPKALIDDVKALVRDHLRPHQLYSSRANIGDGAFRRLALRLPIPRLVRVARADFLGRTTVEALRGEDIACDWLLEECARIDVNSQAPSPLLQGRHLLSLGLKPGPHMGPILKTVFDAQLDGHFDDLDGALAWTKKHLAERDADGAA